MCSQATFWSRSWQTEGSLKRPSKEYQQETDNESHIPTSIKLVQPAPPRPRYLDNSVGKNGHRRTAHFTEPSERAI